MISSVLTTNIQDAIQNALQNSVAKTTISCCGSTYPVYEFMTIPSIIPVIFDRIVWKITNSTNTESKISVNNNINIKSCNRNIKHTLQGIILHAGDKNHTNRGHYYACINKNEEWFILNDKISKRVYASQVRTLTKTDL